MWTWALDCRLVDPTPCNVHDIRHSPLPKGSCCATSSLLDLTSAKPYPATKDANHRRGAKCGYSDGKDCLQSSRVRINNKRHLLRGKRFANLCRTGSESDCGVNLWEVGGKCLNQLVVER